MESPLYNILMRKIFLAAFLLTSNAIAVNMRELIGFTLIAMTNVDGEFNGADYDKTVKLNNGMVFEFTEYNYSYSYRPDASVFAKTYSVPQLQAMKVQNAKQPITLYKLLIENEIYDVRRIK